MIPSEEDVADGFLLWWPLAATGYIAEQIPVSRVYYGVVAERNAWPNACIKVSLQNIERMSGSTIIVKYDVTIEAMAYDTDGGRLTAALQMAFECNSVNPKIDIANAVSVIHVNMKPGGSCEPQGIEMRRDGVDLKKITAKYEVCLQGDREWPT